MLLHTESHFLQVEKFVAPKPETVQAVNAWLSDSGISAKKVTPAGDWLTFNVTVSKAKDLFAADWEIYKHSETGKTSIRTLAYSIPSDLQAHLQVVHPTLSYVTCLPSLYPY
jgi:tripeptidyl-peptidase-1